MDVGTPRTAAAGELEGLLDVSQHGESSIVAALVQADWPPYLVDVGAHDGRSLSNSFAFTQLGWSGVLVEPLPRAFERMAALYRERPDVHCVQAACSDRDGEMRLRIGDDGPSPMTSTLDARRAGGETIRVTVKSLTSLLDEHEAPADFSLLFVDAEGVDLEVLAGLDFDRYRPRVIVTEDDVANAARHADKYLLLQRRGYVLYTVVGATNSVWISGSSDAEPGSGPPAPMLTPEEAIRAMSRPALERRCAELERSRDEIWQQLQTLTTSRSWRLTRPLRRLGSRLRTKG
jgi:FkbM family methyltransferase